MPWNGSGTYTLVYDWVADKNAAINPQAVRFKAQDDDIATALNNCLTRDAQGKPSGDFSFNSFKGIALANATLRTDAINAAQYQDGTLALATGVAGTDTITATMSPAITVYANGMVVRFIPAVTNTGAATLNLNAVAARSIVKTTGVALVAGDLVAGVPAAVIYDLANTRWVLLSHVKVPDASLSSNVALLNASNAFTGGYQFNNFTPDSRYYLGDTTAGSGLVYWYIGSDGGVLQIATANDAGSGVASAITLTKNSSSTVTAAAIAATSITLNGVNITDYARLSQINTFAGAIIDSNTLPQFIWDQSNAAANNRKWNAIVNAEQWSLRLYDDALSTSFSVITIERTGNVADSLALAATAITLTGTVSLNGVSSTDYARLSTTNTWTNAAQGISATNGAWSVTDTGVTAALAANWVGTTSNNSFSIRTNNSNRVTVDNTGAITTNNSNASEFGFKGMPINSASGGYTLVLADAGKTVKTTSGNVTVPDDSGVAFPDGTMIQVHNRTGGNITVTKTTAGGLKWNGFDGSTGARTLANNSTAVLYKSQGDEWLISGTGLT